MRCTVQESNLQPSVSHWLFFSGVERSFVLHKWLTVECEKLHSVTSCGFAVIRERAHHFSGLNTARVTILYMSRPKCALMTHRRITRLPRKSTKSRLACCLEIQKVVGTGFRCFS